MGLFTTELIDRQPSWTSRAQVEQKTAAWVHWFNTDRPHSSIRLPTADRVRGALACHLDHPAPEVT